MAHGVYVLSQTSVELTFMLDLGVKDIPSSICESLKISLDLGETILWLYLNVQWAHATIRCR